MGTILAESDLDEYEFGSYGYKFSSFLAWGYLTAHQTPKTLPHWHIPFLPQAKIKKCNISTDLKTTRHLLPSGTPKYSDTRSIFTFTIFNKSTPFFSSPVN